MQYANDMQSGIGGTLTKRPGDDPAKYQDIEQLENSIRDLFERLNAIQKFLGIDLHINYDKYQVTDISKYANTLTPPKKWYQIWRKL